MQKKKKPNAEQMIAAINRHNIESLRKLLIEGADPNAVMDFSHRGNISVLMCAAGVQFIEGVEALLGAGADPNIRAVAGPGAGGGGTALHNAISGSDNRPYDDPKRSTEEDRLKIVDLLLKAGADPNAVDQGDTLPLHSAARSGHIEICQRLIEAGATFKTWPSGCMPPLTGAVNFGNAPEGQKQERVAELLLELGAPVDGESASGVTALMAAAAAGSEQLVNLYLNHGANVNHHSKDGRTPLHCAAVFARDAATERQRKLALSIVKRLVDAGADPNVKNADGETACDVASRFRASPAAEYLKSRQQPI
jgi:ankyrin repeat protein